MKNPLSVYERGIACYRDENGPVGALTESIFSGAHQKVRCGPLMKNFNRTNKGYQTNTTFTVMKANKSMFWGTYRIFSNERRPLLKADSLPTFSHVVS